VKRTIPIEFDTVGSGLIMIISEIVFAESGAAGRLRGRTVQSVAQLAALVGENLRLDPHEARPLAPVRSGAVDHDGMAEDGASWTGRRGVCRARPAAPATTAVPWRGRHRARTPA
jgi:hypothetical protein